MKFNGEMFFQLWVKIISLKNPMTPRIKTNPDISENSDAHNDARIMGNDHFRLWSRNVIDEFKELSEEQIKFQLQKTAFPYAVLFENFINDFNIASSIRNANAFNAREVFYIGDKKFDKRGMCGVHNYTDVTFINHINELSVLKNKYRFVAIDNVSGATELADYSWQDNSLIIFGSEGVGITPEMLKLADDIVYIPQHGSVRSLNVSTASGIIMNDFVQKFKWNNRNKTLNV
jgi:tRNA G18 (ribose-2'-O)-methylase SpoU